MKIMKFVAENVKGLRVFQVEPHGSDVTISGKNGSGKSSVLDAIMATLAGGDMPIRNGADRARTEIDMGDVIVTRIKTEKTDRLVVKSKEGLAYPEPRATLAKMVGDLTIDPLAFVRLKGRDRLDLLFRLVPGLEADLQRADVSIEAIKTDRSVVLAAGKKARFELDAMPAVLDVPEAAVSLSDLLTEYEKAEAANVALTERRKIKEARTGEALAARSRAQGYSDEVAALEKRIATLQADIDKELEAAEKKEAEAAGFGDIPEDADLGPIRARMAAAEADNKRFAAAEARKAKEAQVATLTEDYSAKGRKLAAAEEKRAELLANAAMPMPGLSVSRLDVVYNGVPVDSLSTAERVRVGTALAVAQNPKARILLVDDASLLDADSLAAMKTAAPDFQIWTVVNDTTGTKGFYIEDGSLCQ